MFIARTGSQCSFLGLSTGLFALADEVLGLDASNMRLSGCLKNEIADLWDEGIKGIVLPPTFSQPAYAWTERLTFRCFQL